MVVEDIIKKIIAFKTDVGLIDYITKIIKNVKGIKEINISDLKSGVYYIKVGNVTKKLIIE